MYQFQIFPREIKSQCVAEFVPRDNNVYFRTFFPSQKITGPGFVYSGNFEIVNLYDNITGLDTDPIGRATFTNRSGSWKLST